MNRRTKHILSLWGIPLIAISIGACQPVAESGRKATLATRDGLHATGDRLASYFTLPPYKEPMPPAPPEQRYCYQTMQDIMCYTHPKPGAENRLVAAQDVYSDRIIVAPSPPTPVTAVKAPPATTSATPVHPVKAPNPQKTMILHKPDPRPPLPKQVVRATPIIAPATMDDVTKDDTTEKEFAPAKPVPLF